MRPDYGSLSDGDLATLAVGGADAAYAEIVRRHRSHVYRVILGNVADADEALDLTQETFVSAHGALRRYDPARPMRGWLAAIAQQMPGLGPAPDSPPVLHFRPRHRRRGRSDRR